MPAGLLPIIYLAFISLGLPDSAIGSAWPTMAPQLGAGISWVGAITMIISCGTIFSSLMSVRVVERFGTGRVTVASVVLTAAALVGFSQAQAFWQLVLLAIPYGLGAGAVDAALNAYVAVHYESQHMSWLHCMWGVGASAGPIIMAQCLNGATWSLGFLVLGGIQVLIAVVITLSLPLWRDKKLPHSEEGHAAGEGAVHHKTRAELLRVPGVPAVLICFFCYCALEGTCGTWAATYCNLGRGINAATAAGWASPFLPGYYRRPRGERLYIHEDARSQHDPSWSGHHLDRAAIGGEPVERHHAGAGPGAHRCWLCAHLPLYHPCHAGPLWRRGGP